MTLVYVDNVHKAFGDLEVLKGINLSVSQGEVVAIIGRSGSGKSTLLRCLNQLEKHDSGEITIADKQLDAASMSSKELSENVGMVFQSFNLFPHKTVGENVCLAPIVVRGEGKAEVEKIAREVLEKVGLSDKYDAYPAQLSGGQQQRVAIARALAMRPKVMLCDEVTSALDPELVGEVLRVLEALAAEGMTLILVTHEMSFARDVADRVVFMHQGRIHEEGAPSKLFSNPKTPELKQFISAVL